MRIQWLISIVLLSLCMVLFNNCGKQSAKKSNSSLITDIQAELEANEDMANLPEEVITEEGIAEEEIAMEPIEEPIPIGPIDPNDEISVPGEEDPPTGGNIVLPTFYDQASILGQADHVRIHFRASPDDTYTATVKNLPDGLSFFVDSGKKRITFTGTPTALAMASSPYEVELTIANSTDSRTVKYKWNIHDGVEPNPNPNNVTPCGGNPGQGGTLWSWSWAGLNRDKVTIGTTRGKSVPIVQMMDLSGNNNFYFTPSGRLTGHASEDGGYTWRNYYTPYSTVGLDTSAQTRYEYFGQGLDQNGSLNADKEFYLAAAVMNTRAGGNGNREIFGSRSRGNGLSYTQGAEAEGYSARGVLGLMIAGTSKGLTPRYSYPLGPLLIEVWRDSNNVVHSRVNGVDKTNNGGVLFPGVFDMTGLSSATASGFDDAGFEYIVCKGATSASRMDQTRDYLRQKWKLY